MMIAGTMGRLGYRALRQHERIRPRTAAVAFCAVPTELIGRAFSRSGMVEPAVGLTFLFDLLRPRNRQSVELRFAASPSFRDVLVLPELVNSARTRYLDLPCEIVHGVFFAALLFVVDDIVVSSPS